MIPSPTTCRLAGAVAGAVVITAAGAAQPDPAWVRHYDGPASRSDAATTIALGPGGTVSVVGVSDDAAGVSDIVTIRYDATGNELWTQRYDNALEWIDEPRGVGVDSAGNTYVVGVTWGGSRHSGGSDWDYLTIKYGPDGSQLWTRQYNGHGNWSDIPESMTVDSAGNTYIAGFSLKEPDSLGRYATHFHVLKYDTDGNMAWEYLFDFPQHLGAGARDVRLDGAGNVLATGIAQAGDLSGAQDDIYTVKLAPDGSVLWEAQYDSGGANPGLDDSFHVRADAAGNVYVIGHVFTSEDNRNFDTLLLKYSPAGQLQWEAKMDFVRADGAGELVFDDEGNIYMSGGWDNEMDVDGYIVSFRADGVERWRHVYDGPSPWDFQEALSIMLGPDGDLYVGLDWQYDDDAGYDFTIARHDTDGAMKEQWRFDTGTHTDSFTSLGGFAMDGAGAIYIAGYSWRDATLADFTTMKIPGDGACYADCDGSGALDLFDFLCFQNQFAAGDPQADCDGSGRLDFFDFLCFQNAFAAMCR
ncbi:MAG: SBBP repeat-containing protein [Phycisphaerales bacterium JB039]